MKIRVEKSRLGGSIEIPASKSHTIRAIAIASLAEGRSVLKNPLVSSDAISAAECYRQLGAEIDTSNPQEWLITGTGGRICPPDDTIDVGNSGTTLRLAVGSAALGPKGSVIRFTGDEQICRRPIEPLLNSLNDLGANAVSTSDNGCAPVEIRGTLTGGATTIECITSQYLSSLLMAAPLAAGDTRIDVPLLYEPDYVRITTDWLDRQNIQYTAEGLEHFTIKGGQSYSAFDSRIPADFSSATFFLCAAAMTGETVTLRGLDYSDSQPDKLVVEYLRRMGADITIDNDLTIIKGSQLTGIDIDMNKTPDALPMMAVVGAFAGGTTRLLNVPQARNKETDRIACMAAELKKMGVDIEELPDGLVIRQSRLKAATIDGHHDHRIVMAAAVAGCLAEGTTTIETAEAMNVTFPNFVELMNSAGASMSICD